MNRNQLIDHVARTAGLDAATATAAVAAALDAVVTAVAAGEQVRIAEFGTFEARERSARQGRNPQTGEPIEIAATTAPAFRAASAFRARVAAGASR
ncbi:HU family DNA-binding protein [Pimelobacter simplex]|uniref:HU family DNA-binding protein n=2 Tax=Pimelobacter TaxID=2044 RepID=UPI00215019EB|nr:HU family DNA-binding protein [Pimelobacter simplex]UUW90547.1 HU family DNA-binding protein [Pimelobacter simplex]UUW94378.1 HU family DNA-binding protein [Pimelobacter simplex]